MLVDRSAFDRELSGEPYSLGSEACRLDHFLRPDYAFWCNLSKDPPRFHRKQWEFWYIFVALRERGKIAPGMRGLGFGVGSEPMADAFASFGCAIVATDQASEAAHAQGWSETNQHAEGLRAVRTHRVSSDEAFANVSFEIADMNAIGSHLRQFDFCWSSCAFEHLGSIRHGLDFVRNSIDTLKPGGVAVHTTELHMDSNDATIETPTLSIFRRRDFEELAAGLRADGHHVAPLNFYLGVHELERYVDLPPYCADPCLRLDIGGHRSTSFGLIVTKREDIAAA
jgi:SAM-dependent methyltransferase